MASTDRLIVADGVATFTVFDADSTPRIALTSTARVLAGTDGASPSLPPRRLPGEIRQIADDVRRAMKANRILVGGSSQIGIEIRLHGPRPSFDFSYRGRKA